MWTEGEKHKDIFSKPDDPKMNAVYLNDGEDPAAVGLLIDPLWFWEEKRHHVRLRVYKGTAHRHNTFPCAHQPLP